MKCTKLVIEVKCEDRATAEKMAEAIEKEVIDKIGCNFANSYIECQVPQSTSLLTFQDFYGKHNE